MRVALFDPTYTPRENETLSERTAAALIQDPRDLPFVKLMVVLSLLVIPSGVWLFLPGAF
jgi:hypothetical protein